MPDLTRLDVTLFLTTLVSLFAIINPVGSIPVFVTLTSDLSRPERRRVIRKAAVVAALVLVLFALVGRYVFQVFGITMHAFLIAGGILIGKYAWDLMHGQRPRADASDREIKDALDRDEIALTPLGVPLLAGPGAITTIMILTGSTNNVLDHVVIYAAIFIVLVSAFLILTVGGSLLDRFGRSGLNAFARIMGLMLAAVAVQFVLLGLHGVAPDVFPGAVQSPAETLDTVNATVND